MNGVVRGENYASSRVHNVRCAGYRWSVLRSREGGYLGFPVNGASRGGYYNNNASLFRCGGYRNRGSLSNGSNFIGFRLVNGVYKGGNVTRYVYMCRSSYRVAGGVDLRGGALGFL